MADTVVPWHSTADRRGGVIVAARPNFDMAIDQDVLPARLLADLDLRRRHEQDLGDRAPVLLPWTATFASGDDPAEHVALTVGGSGVDIHANSPGGARLILVPVPDHHRVPGAQVDVTISPFGDAPTDRELAEAVPRSRAWATVNHSTRTDGIAVARFEVRTGDPPLGHAGSVKLVRPLRPPPSHHRFRAAPPRHAVRAWRRTFHKSGDRRPRHHNPCGRAGGAPSRDRYDDRRTAATR